MLRKESLTYGCKGSVGRGDEGQLRGVNPGLLEVDTQSHVLQCTEYGDLRVDKDLKKDEDMKYFSQLIKRRMKE